MHFLKLWESFSAAIVSIRCSTISGSHLFLLMTWKNTWNISNQRLPSSHTPRAAETGPLEAETTCVNADRAGALAQLQAAPCSQSPNPPDPHDSSGLGFLREIGITKQIKGPVHLSPSVRTCLGGNFRHETVGNPPHPHPHPCGITLLSKLIFFRFARLCVKWNKVYKAKG